MEKHLLSITGAGDKTAIIEGIRELLNHVENDNALFTTAELHGGGASVTVRIIKA